MSVTKTSKQTLANLSGLPDEEFWQLIALLEEIARRNGHNVNRYYDALVAGMRQSATENVNELFGD